MSEVYVNWIVAWLILALILFAIVFVAWTLHEQAKKFRNKEKLKSKKFVNVLNHNKK